MRGRIVVVEDDAGVLQLLQDIFGDEGYEFVDVRGPEAALEAAFERKPDLFLIDVMLPKQSGIEVADKLWLNGFSDVPMVAISASSIMRDLARHTSLFQAVVNKPFDLTEFTELVDRLITATKPLAD
ncbi:MAG: response regulator [Chloroflexota bacterium]